MTTANSWHGPIGHFVLGIESEQPDDVVLTCMPGVRRVAITRYEMKRTNSAPIANSIWRSFDRTRTNEIGNRAVLKEHQDRGDFTQRCLFKILKEQGSRLTEPQKRSITCSTRLSSSLFCSG